MIKFNQIDHINFTVKDLDISSKFYKEVFGFEVFEEETRNGSRYQIVGKSQKAMICLYEAKDENIKRVDFGESRFNHIGFNVEFGDDIIKDLKSKDVEIVYFDGEAIIDYPDSKSVYIRDPDGNEIELSNNLTGGL